MPDDKSPAKSRRHPRGRERVLNLLKGMDPQLRQGVMDTLEEIDPSLRTGLERDLLTFEELYYIQDREFEHLIRRVRLRDRELWPLALRRCSPQMHGKILRCMSTRARDETLYRLETMGRRQIAAVHQAQERIVDIAFVMIAQGFLTLPSDEPMI